MYGSNSLKLSFLFDTISEKKKILLVDSNTLEKLVLFDNLSNWLI